MRALFVLAATILSLSAPVHGAPCAGFTDVDDSSAFCPSITWMKNRQVTQGCGPGLYCPSNNVTRDQMAAFMNRMANVTTGPVWVDANNKTIGPLDGQSTNAFWRTNFGVAVVTFACGNGEFPGDGFGLCTWSKQSSDELFYATGNCTGPAYVMAGGSSFGLLRAIGFYWRGSEYRMFKRSLGAIPTPMPGVIYLDGRANVTVWSGNESANGCLPRSVGSQWYELFIPVTDLGDVSAAIADPVHIE